MSGSSGEGEPCGNYICASDVDNWPSGTTEEEQQALIEAMEELIEKIAKTFFYPKTFDIRLNGNDKNRLFLPLSANIIAVTAVYVWGELLDTTWYTWDKNSILVDLEQAWGPDVELDYKLGQVDVKGLFPRGYNNIRVIGTYGLADVPAWVSLVAKILVQDQNDPTLYSHYTLASERIGDYSYSMGSAGVVDYPTGIVEADTWLRRFKRGKSIIMAP